MKTGKYSEYSNCACLLISFTVYDALIRGQHHGSIAHSGPC